MTDTSYGLVEEGVNFQQKVSMHDNEWMVIYGVYR